MMERLRRFMYGRYGQDDLNRFISIAAMVVMVISMFIGRAVLSPVVLLLLILCFFRMLSKKTTARGMENLVYLRLRGKFIRWFTSWRDRFNQRKTHRFYKCPSCHVQLRVPRGKGRIKISCPQCRTSFERKT